MGKVRLTTPSLARRRHAQRVRARWPIRSAWFIQSTNLEFDGFSDVSNSDAGCNFFETLTAAAAAAPHGGIPAHRGCRYNDDNDLRIIIKMKSVSDSP